MNFYYEDCLDDFVNVCEYIGMTSKQIRDVLNMSISSTPRTWQNQTARNYADVVANWFAKELNRSGDSVRNSERRCKLYKQRRSMINYADTKLLRSMSPEFCEVSGHPINYGLGVTKQIYNDYFKKKYNMIGISPSIERIDSDLGYSIDNIEIISSYENIGRNMSVNTDFLRTVYSTFDSLNNSLPNQVQTIRLLQAGQCTITFRKLDGTKREMVATQNLSFVPEDRHPKGLKKSPNHIINVWDCNKQDWRSFSYYRLEKLKV